MQFINGYIIHKVLNTSKLLPPRNRLEQFIAFDYVCFFTDSVEATGSGENVTVAGGVAKAFTCPVDGNPEPRIEWYNNKTGRKISIGKQLEARESGCYTCVASNSLGTSVNITQCLIICKLDHALLLDYGLTVA